MTQHDNFNKGLQDAATRHGVGIDIEAYHEGRDRKAVMPYAEPVAPVPTQKPALDATTALIVRIAPPVIALTALGSIVLVVVAMTAAAIGAGFAFISANLAWVGGGVVAVAVGVLAWAGRASGGSDRGNAAPPPPNDGGKWEYYQEQKQGWRKV